MDALEAEGTKMALEPRIPFSESGMEIEEVPLDFDFFMFTYQGTKLVTESAGLVLENLEEDFLFKGKSA